jgi:hypothetical protein
MCDVRPAAIDTGKLIMRCMAVRTIARDSGELLRQLRLVEQDEE